MSEAHEKTRIRQLEDAAAHWEHKYTNAREYNRNLEQRNAALEARCRSHEELLSAIRGLFPCAAPPVKEQIQYMLKWIDAALPNTAETGAEHICPTCGTKFRGADDRFCPTCHAKDHAGSPLGDANG